MNPCDNAPNWPAAPNPLRNPLKVMEWATGKQKDKFGCTRDGGTKFHAAIDIKAAVGTECYAVSDAKVEEVGYGDDVGTYVSISYKIGAQIIGVAYCHLSKTQVKKGDTVTAGAVLGKTGTSGNADPAEPHLHLEYQKQVWVAYADASDRSKITMNPNSLISG